MLANAELVVTSTHNEIEQQYGLYNYYDPAGWWSFRRAPISSSSSADKG